MKLALVHDMAESLVGDITPYQGISKEEKHKKEEVVDYCFHVFNIDFPCLGSHAENQTDNWRCSRWDTGLIELRA
jgi:5'-deoxynucleotidase YfbR-like HD superfamily hydrolase